MSPTRALHSPVFWFYLALAAGLLVAGGAILAVLKWGLRKNVGHAWAALGGWLVVVPILLLVFFLGREVGIAFVAAVGLLGFHEYARATGLSRDWVLTGTVHLGVVAVGVACWTADPADGRPGWYGLFMALPVFVTIAVLAVPVVCNRTKGELAKTALALLGYVYFGWTLGHLAFLTNVDLAYSYLGYLVLAVELNDVAAYSFGKLFGRHRLRGNVSPNKTWEGAAGALVVSVVLPWALWFTLPNFETRDCLLVGFLVGVGGQLGDLAVSVMKRDLGIKDMGAAIPGHGGILDRIDSLVYVAPLFFHYVRFRFGLTPP